MKPKELTYIPIDSELPINGTPYSPDELGTQIMTIGTSRRTTVLRKSSIPGGPIWKDGVRKGLYTAVDATGDVEIFEIKSSRELANLPSNAINIHTYLNLLREENIEVSTELSEIIEEIEHHTAHHTAGADKGERLKALLRQSQLSSLTYQDKKIGEGIKIPDSMGQKVSPDSLTGDDGVE